MSFAILYLDGCVSIELGHALNFYELHVIAIFESVSFVFMRPTDCFFLVCHRNVGYDEAFCFFPVVVENLMLVGVVQESITCYSEALTQDETFARCMSGFVAFNEVRESMEVFGED